MHPFFIFTYIYIYIYIYIYNLYLNCRARPTRLGRGFELRGSCALENTAICCTAATVRSKWLPKGAFEATVRSKWLPQGAFEATVRSNQLHPGGALQATVHRAAFEATVRSNWLPQGAFEATVRSQWPPRVPGCPRMPSTPLCARNGRTGYLRGHCALDLVAHRGCLQGHCTRALAFKATVRSKWPPRAPGCPRVPSRPHCALDLVAHWLWPRGCLQGHCTLWSSPRRHRGARACVCAARRSEKLLEASVLGFTEPCLTALGCTLHRAWICTGSH